MYGCKNATSKGGVFFCCYRDRRLEDQVQDDQYNDRDAQEPANEKFTHDSVPSVFAVSMGPSCALQRSRSVRYCTSTSKLIHLVSRHLVRRARQERGATWIF
jgi:hypothetical protein